MGVHYVVFDGMVGPDLVVVFDEDCKYEWMVLEPEKYEASSEELDARFKLVFTDQNFNDKDKKLLRQYLVNRERYTEGLDLTVMDTIKIRLFTEEERTQLANSGDDRALTLNIINTALTDCRFIQHGRLLLVRDGA